jgi:hypothetical protein
VTDSDGLTATTTGSLTINAPPGGLVGTQFGVTINNGDQFARTPKVVVTAKFPAITTNMLFSNDGGFLAPQTFKPQKETEWTLDSSGPERLPKTIYIRFLANGITSETYQDDIILDEIPPVVQQAAVASASAAPSTVHAAKLKTWKLKIKATDSNSGVAKIQATSNTKKPGPLLAYKTKLKVKSAKKPKFIRARDRAGNYSKWKKAR